MFLMAARRQRMEQQMEGLSQQWMGQHLSQKGLKKVLADIERAILPPDEQTKQIKNQWRGLRTALKSLKTRGRK